MATTVGEPLIERIGTAQRSRRLMAMLDLINSRGSVALTDLTRTLGISAATARRDLTELADQRLVIRRHGGAAAVAREAELPVGLRDARNAAAKRNIARAAARRIPAGRHVVGVSGGSTTGMVVRELSGRTDLVVVTNSLTIAALLSGRSGVRVLVSGGILRDRSQELVGAIAENSFRAVNIGTAVLGADGVSADHGVTTHDETEARTNHAMVAGAERVLVVADGTKIGHAAFAQMAPVSEVDVLVTDSSADADELARLRAAGVEVVIADPE